MARKRVDTLLVAGGKFPDVATARRAIMAGEVRIGTDHLVHRASETYPADTVFTVTPRLEYVSRAAGKLLPALDRYLPRLDGLVALDLGAATGGFTDLMRQRGARRVYAVDVGKGLLHGRLRRDPAIVVLEETHARDLTRALVPDPVDVLTADLSFTSLTRVLAAAAPLLASTAWAFLLIKPQFEAARKDVGAGGIVRDEAVRRGACSEVVDWCTAELGWQTVDLVTSPVKGAKGNQEYVGVFRAK